MDEWETPRVTQNAVLLTGVLAGCKLEGYRVVEITGGILVLENERNGNRYSVNVEQIAGVE